MRKFFLALFASILAAGLAVSVSACGGEKSHEHIYNEQNDCTVCGEHLNFTEGLKFELTEENTYTVTGIGTAEGVTELVIPAYYNGKAVTEIGRYAFSGNAEIESVVIPNGVTAIDLRAFFGCSALAKISLPAGAIEIVSDAFDGTAYFADEKNWDGDVFYIGDILMQARDTLSGEYKIKKGTRVIAQGAFMGVYRDNKYSGCPNLKAIVIPESLEFIGPSVFSYCNALEKVIISDLAAWCKITFADNYSNPLYHDAHLFLKGQEITDLVIPDGISEIKAHAFVDCNGVKRITIPSGVTTIGESAFEWCESLESVTIGVGVTAIGEHAFYRCINLKNIQYQGTSAAWENIEKGSSWAPYEGCTVTCSDGTKVIASS